MHWGRCVRRWEMVLMEQRYRSRSTKTCADCARSTLSRGRQGGPGDRAAPVGRRGRPARRSRPGSAPATWGIDSCHGRACDSEWPRSSTAAVTAAKTATALTLKVRAPPIRAAVAMLRNQRAFSGDRCALPSRTPSGLGAQPDPPGRDPCQDSVTRRRRTSARDSRFSGLATGQISNANPVRVLTRLSGLSR